MWQPTHWKKTLMLGKIEGSKRRDDRGWDSWMASLTQWTWVWANSVRKWRTGKPGMLQSMGLQGVGHNWATEQQLNILCNLLNTVLKVKNRVAVWVTPLVLTAESTLGLKNVRSTKLKLIAGWWCYSYRVINLSFWWGLRIAGRRNWGIDPWFSRYHVLQEDN